MRLFKDKPWQTIVLSPALLALVPSILIIFLLPDHFPKYAAQLADQGFIDKPGGFEYYYDLDHDGSSERIILFDNTQKEASIKIVEEDGTIGKHVYFHGEIHPKFNSLKAGSVDSTGAVAIFVFTTFHDSLLLNCIFPYHESKAGFRDKFITVVSQKAGTYDFVIGTPELIDLDGDGSNELVSGVMSGFPLKPRFVFAYDYARDSLITSEDFGPLVYINSIKDINRDGKCELFTQTYSVYNYPDSLTGLRDDHKALILGFDHTLQPLFSPVEIPGKYILIITLPVKTETGESRLISVVTQSVNEGCYPRLILSDLYGNELDERELGALKGEQYSLHADLHHPDRLILYTGQGKYEVLDASLNKIHQFRLDSREAGLYFQRDVDGDGRLEYIGYTGKSYTPTIWREGFTDPVPLTFPLSSVIWDLSIRQLKGKSAETVIQQQDKYYSFAYGKNPYFLWKYPMFIGIYLASLAIILIAQYLQRIASRQRYKAEKKIAELQLLLLKNQLDPHFNFNAISGINSLVAMKRPEEANRMISQISRLMRASVDHTDKLSRTLEEELSFVRDYLSLEQAGMEDPFELEIVTDPGVDMQREVPKMITQIYAENAVKHGLRLKGPGGKLTITIGTTAPPHHITTAPLHHLTIFIEDNGIGRRAAAQNGSGGTGKGTGIMEQYFAILNKYNVRKITHRVLDLMNETGHPCGTRVEIEIPEGVKYDLY